MQQEIVESAGQIWNYLNERGTVTTTKMKKDLSLDDNFAAMGLGWLAREDKLNFEGKGARLKVSLR